MLSGVYVKSWAAVMLDQASGELQEFGCFENKGIIPAGTSRRLGAFGKMAIGCGLSVSGSDSSDLVFCSRFGDLDIAYRLLRDLSVGGLLSPAAFSNSVHNAVPGVMDLVRKSKVGHTAIAAGTQSLSAGFAECWAKLVSTPDQDVSLVLAEGVLPDELLRFSPDDSNGIALAMTLSAHRPANVAGHFKLISDARSGILDEPVSSVLALAIVKELDRQAQPGGGLYWRSRGLSWSFEARPDAAG